MLQWPLHGTITSRFGSRSGHSHDGIDIGAPPGTDVLAAADGEVVFADAHGGYGNVVILRHRNGLLTIYAHHERNLVRKGQEVRAGDPIARVGTTGKATGPHLHFEVRQGTRPQNPMRFSPLSRMKNAQNFRRLTCFGVEPFFWCRLSERIETERWPARSKLSLPR